MSKPAARIGDKHSCSLETAGVPHEGGPITGPGCTSVLIEGMPAATRGDTCFCVGVQDVIIEGSASVYIGGKPAARFSDMCLHGGQVTGYAKTVFIGDTRPIIEPVVDEEEDKDGWPPEEERVKIINQAIKDCIALLEKKLTLLKNNDRETLVQFKQWFGRDDGEARGLITSRIEKQFRLFRSLSAINFKRMPLTNERRIWFAYVYPTDESFTIYLGNPYWQASVTGKGSKAGILIHETSHFKSIGKTKDYGYYEECDTLAKDRPDRALNNADSYEYFIISK